MKRIIVLYILLLKLCMPVMAQKDCCDKLEALITEKIKLKESLQHTTDSLNMIIRKHRVEIIDLQLNVNRLIKDSVILANYEPQMAQLKLLQQENKQLQKDTIGHSSFNFQKNALIIIQNELKTVKDTVQNLKAAYKRLDNDKSNTIKDLSECSSVMNKRYQTSFDSLMYSSTTESIENDLKLIQYLNIEIDKKQKIFELLTYKRAEELLREKFDKNKIEKAKQSLQIIINKEPVKVLLFLLNKYENCVTNLKSTINEIQKNNSKKTGTIEDLISEKKDETLRIIEDYIFYNEIDLTKYVYINKIVDELKVRKMKNVDADVQDFLEKL